MENNHIFNVLDVCEGPQPGVGHVDDVEVVDEEAWGRNQVQDEVGAVLNGYQGLIVTDQTEPIS